MTRSGSRPLSHAHQALALRAYFPDAVTQVRAGALTWRGRLRPTAASRAYLVEVDYVRNEFPIVHVLEPPLEPDAEGALPHLFAQGTLCLHERHEWRPSMCLVDTTMAWTSEWLYFYEIWLATGLWFGDGDEAGRELHGVDDEHLLPRSRADRRYAARHPPRARLPSALGFRGMTSPLALDAAQWPRRATAACSA